MRVNEAAWEKLKKQIKWTVIDGAVYDITNYIDIHPGGKK